MVGDSSRTLQDLASRARASMQQGRWQQAETLLLEGLSVAPRDAQLLRLIGTLCHVTKRHDEAISYLQQALDAAPDDTRSRINLGAALLARGRLQDAQAHFVEVLSRHPDMEDARLNLGLVLQRLGRIDEAAAQFETVLETNPRAADARLSLALTCLSRAQYAQALAHAEHLTRSNALVPDALSVRIKALLGLHKSEQACALAADAVRAHPAHAALRASLADTLVTRGQLQEAVAAYEAAIAAGDQRVETVMACAQCLLEAGLNARAVQLLGRHVAMRSASPDGASDARVLQLLGDAWCADGQYREALDAYQQARRAQPESVALLCRVAGMLLASGDDGAAMQALETAVQLDPAASEPHQVAIEQYIANGNLEAALEKCEAYTSAGHFAHDIVAAQAFVNNALGHTRRARWLFDFDALVRMQVLTPPDGYASLAEFNEALARDLRAHPSLTESGAASKATQNGYQSGNLLNAEHGVFADFERLLWRAANDYLAGLRHDDMHPYLRERPRLTGVHCWGVVLRRAGYQAPHIHPTGWVSGVYYPELPDSLGDDAAHEGWLEFGLPPASLDTGAAFPGSRVKPREGLLVLFPSYLYHSTVPFAADVERVSLAFDFTYG